MNSVQEYALYKKLIELTASTIFFMWHPAIAQSYGGDHKALMAQIGIEINNNSIFRRGVETIAHGAIEAFRNAERSPEDIARDKARISQLIADYSANTIRTAGRRRMKRRIPDKYIATGLFLLVLALYLWCSVWIILAGLHSLG